MTDPFVQNWWELTERRGLSTDEALSLILLLRERDLSNFTMDDLFRMAEEGRLTPEEEVTWAEYLATLPPL